MKALILIDGYDTYLRPLTLTYPKSLIEFANKPIIFHQMEALIAAGINTIILVINYCTKLLEEEIINYANRWNITVHFTMENVSLGIAKALFLANNLLKNEELFLVLNSNIICNFPFQQMINYHICHQHEGTIAITKVIEPSKYDVCIFDEKTGKVKQFVKKPMEYMSNNINAGLYILSSKVFDRISLLLSTSMEKEIFSEMAKDGNLYIYHLDDFWINIRQPYDFLTGTQLYLQFLRLKYPEMLSKEQFIQENVMIHQTAQIGNDCIIGPNVIIGSDVQIYDGVCLRNSTILSNSIIYSHSWINDSIIGKKCIIGNWVRIDNICVLGDNVIVEDELYLNGAQILPYKTITTNVLKPDIIM